MEIILNEIRLIDGVNYNYTEYDKKTSDGKNYSVAIRELTDLEKNELINQARIAELKKIIDNKIYLGDDVTAERAELRTLLGM